MTLNIRYGNGVLIVVLWEVTTLTEYAMYFRRRRTVIAYLKILFSKISAQCGSSCWDESHENCLRRLARRPIYRPSRQEWSRQHNGCIWWLSIFWIFDGIQLPENSRWKAWEHQQKNDAQIPWWKRQLGCALPNKSRHKAPQLRKVYGLQKYRPLDR